MKVAIIGSGFAGLMSANVLAQEGHQVILFEKNSYLGGRASSFQTQGFHFDKGPSWYWMPDIFEEAYDRLNVNQKDLYELVKLDPGFRVYFDENDFVDIPADYAQLRQLFESMETGSAEKLDRFMKEAETKYDIGVKEMARFPSLSIFEFINLKVFRSFLQMDLFKSVAAQVRSLFQSERIRKIMEFPVLFLGASASKIPALYTMMNFAGMKQGTYYPIGGFSKVVDGFVDTAKKNGVDIRLESEITKLHVVKNNVHAVELASGETIEADVFIGAADYAHVDTLLPTDKQNYTRKYWDKKTFAPSSLLFYIGLNKKLTKVEHHNLFFHTDFEQHTKEIYSDPAWPTDPLFYVCCPSITDNTVAPEGSENLFFLMPIAAGLEDTIQIREKYFDVLISEFERLTGEQIRDAITYQRSYCVADFASEYHAYKGNAYGLANTLNQTAVLKPAIKNKFLNNLFYTGQLTVPGPGVPPSIMSGEMVADYITSHFKPAVD